MSLCGTRHLKLCCASSGSRPQRSTYNVGRVPQTFGRTPRQAALDRTVATRCAAETEVETAPSDTKDVVPPGCARYEVALNKPLGMVLEADKENNIFVAEIVPGGNAEISGKISVGDQLISTSGMMYTKGQTYGETFVRGGEKVVQMNVMGESFDAVLAAISSNPVTMGVRLVFQQCE
ncbi:hypothetical protein BSKO_00759 [Bryopsis sp. KO-2023]|nr:hypothetical protein BSKO_00759 [Bryopsis sp. KO-2023]